MYPNLHVLDHTPFEWSNNAQGKKFEVFLQAIVDFACTIPKRTLPTILHITISNRGEQVTHKSVQSAVNVIGEGSDFTTETPLVNKELHFVLFPFV